jgi:addiction module RelB/DinJ family antitoxin
MPPSAILRARVDSTRKRRAEKVLRKLGVTPAQAINMLYAQVEIQRGLPFLVSEKENEDLLPSDEHYGSVMRRNDECAKVRARPVNSRGRQD